MKGRIVLAALMIVMIGIAAPEKADAQCRRHYRSGWRAAPRVIIAPPLPPPVVVVRPRHYARQYAYGRPYGYHRPHYGYRGHYRRGRW